MISLETTSKVRRDHFVHGKSIKESSRGISRNSVRKILRSGETTFEYERPDAPRATGSTDGGAPRPPLRPDLSKAVAPMVAAMQGELATALRSLDALGETLATLRGAADHGAITPRRRRRAQDSARIARDAELRAFIEARFNTSTHEDIRAAARRAFGPARAPSVSAIARWFKKTNAGRK